MTESPSETHPLGGEHGPLDALFLASYNELHRLARSIRRDDLGYTQNTTALVNEAWLRLSNSPDVAGVAPAHFRHIVARAMRQVLVDAARRRKADKRGGNLLPVTLDEAAHGLAVTDGDTLLELDAALEELARRSPRQAQIIDLRFFAGLEIREVAEHLGISQETVFRDWRAARAWLSARLTRER